MHLPLRIAILEADTPIGNTKRKYGGYGGVFEALLKAGAKAHGHLDPETGLQLTKHQIEVDPSNYPNLEDIDAILITGSRHDSFADIPWINTLVDFVTKVLAQDRVRIIGVCFGHQIVGRALGAKVGRSDKGWEAAVHDIQLTETGKRVFGQQTLSLHQMHKDIVFSYPPGVEALGSSPLCKNQGMYIRKRLITVQGHPEFTKDIVQELLDVRFKAGLFNEEAYKTHVGKVALHHDGVIVSRAFLRFLLDDCKEVL